MKLNRYGTPPSCIITTPPAAMITRIGGRWSIRLTSSMAYGYNIKTYTNVETVTGAYRHTLYGEECTVTA